MGRRSTGAFTEDDLNELQPVGVAQRDRKVGPCIALAKKSLRTEVKTGASVHSRKTVFQVQRLLLACSQQGFSRHVLDSWAEASIIKSRKPSLPLGLSLARHPRRPAQITNRRLM